MPERPLMRGIAIIVGLLITAIAGTTIIEGTGLDLALCDAVYEPGGLNDGWIHGRDVPWSMLYDHGEIPVLLMLVAAAWALWSAWLGEVPRSWTRPALVMLFTVALGPGLLVNAVLKPLWGRPRPADVIAFGGDKAYRSVFRPGGPGCGKSFPCGHCSMAFALCGLVAWYPICPRAAVGALAGGIAYGIVMGAARVLQGGHFATDALWAGVIVLVVVAALYYLVFQLPQTVARNRSP